MTKGLLLEKPWLKSAWGDYLNAYAQQRLHHGLLFFGHAGLAKIELAIKVAQHLLCQQPSEQACGQCKSCNLLAAQTHPDYQFISSEKSIGVDLIREAIVKLNSSAQMLGNKVLVIECAERMTESAANALLKTLEEPTGKTFLLLTSSQPQQLLATIRSRCSLMQVKPPSTEQAMLWLKEQGVDQVSEPLLELIGNAPLQAKQMFDSTDYPSFMADFKAMLLNQMSAKHFAENQLNDSAFGLLYLQSWLLQRAKKQSHYVKLLSLVQTASVDLSRTGVNKVLVLSTLCMQLKQQITNQ